MPKGSRNPSAKQRTERRRRRGSDAFVQHTPSRTTLSSIPETLQQGESSDQILPTVTPVKPVRSMTQNRSPWTPAYNQILMGELKRIGLTSSVVLVALVSLVLFLR